MVSTTVSAQWQCEGLDYLGKDSHGNEIPMGKKKVRPSELLLLGLAGCMGMDVLSILQKKRQHITDVKVEVTGHQPMDYPKPFQSIEIAFTVKGVNVDSKAVDRSIELSYTKYCIVSHTLKQDNIDISTSFSIEE